MREKTKMKVLVLITGIICCLVTLTVFPAGAEAAAPCCAITAIDAKSGTVTARNAATGETFQGALDKAGQSRR